MRSHTKVESRPEIAYQSGTKNLLIDVFGSCLVDKKTGKIITSDSCKQIYSTTIHSVSVAFEERIRRTLFEKYPEIVSDNIQPLPVKMKPMRINTGNNLPVYSPCQPLRGKKLWEVKAELIKWIKFDIIESLTEPCRWASPIHCVRKGDGTWRICGYFRRLNTVTEKENFPLPKLDEFSEMVAGCTIFSKCDLTKAYLQLSVAKEDWHKTVINIPIGIFQFKRMPFGLLNSAQKFMQAIRQVLCRHQTFCARTKLFMQAPERRCNKVNSMWFRWNQLTFSLQRERIEIDLDEFRTHLESFRWIRAENI